MRKLIKLIPFITVFVIIAVSIGYSAFGTDLLISKIVAEVRVKADIRITGIGYDENSSIDYAISNYEDYNVDSINVGLNLPNATSSFTYKIKVTNFGSLEMGIFDIVGLPNNLDYEMVGYSLKNKLCDNDNNCTLGVTKEFFVTIKYKDNGYDSSNLDYDIQLNFDFRNFLPITYIGFAEYTTYPNSIIYGGDLNITFDNAINELAVRIDDIILQSNSYEFDGYNLSIKNIINNIDVINLDGSTFISGIEFNYLIKNGEYAPEGDVEEYYNEDKNRLVDHTVKKIIFGKKDVYASEVATLTAEPIDVHRTGMINLYRKKDNDGKYIIYILSKNGEFILNENASWTFDKLYDLEEIVNLHLLDTSNVIKMRDMFCDCASIKSLDLSNFDTSKVTNMIGMFARTYELEYLDLSSFDTSNLVTMNQMFSASKILKKIYVSNKWKITDKLESGTGVFSECNNLIGGNGTELTTDVTFKMAVVDTASSPGYLTSDYKFLPGVEFNHIIKNLTQSQIDAWTISNRYQNVDVTKIVFGRTRDYPNIVSFYSGIAVDADKSGVIKSYRVINNDGTYTVYILSNSGNFIANEDSSWMFDKLIFLKEITNLKMLNTGQTSNMRDMFCDCQYLNSLDLSNFNTQNATTFEGMFARMYMIKVLDLSNFNTNKLTSLKNTFAYSISATETHESLKDVVPALKTVYVSNNWNTSNITLTDTSFSNCVNLVGGNGTTFNSNNITATYARIDIANTPGYFTLK